MNDGDISSREAPLWVKGFYDQAAAWWGNSNRSAESLAAYGKLIEKLSGPGMKSVLDLGAGTGAVSEYVAGLGHRVTAVELSPARAAMIRERAAMVTKGCLTVVEGDFLSVPIRGTFDVVCCWEVFGIGTDDNQRRLLTRMANEWLSDSPEACAIVEVYSPVGPIKFAGTSRHLKALKGVPGSVDMINTCRYDPVESLWQDEWKPVDEPSKARMQSLRCYTPADFRLILAGTGLYMTRAEYRGLELFSAEGAPLMGDALFDCEDDYAYVAKLVRISGHKRRQPGKGERDSDGVPDSAGRRFR